MNFVTPGFRPNVLTLGSAQHSGATIGPSFVGTISLSVVLLVEEGALGRVPRGAPGNSR